MNKIKVAILEDSERLLNDLKRDLDESGLVEVVVKATNSKELLEKVKVTHIDAVILDIDLGSDSMTGIDVANHLKLPVLFVSGKTKEFLDGIENLNLSFSSAVEHVSKPITEDKLKKILSKFLNAVKLEHESKFVRLDFGDSKHNKISIDSIVCLESDTGKSGESNNKVIYFTNRKPETLFNFSFSKAGDILLGNSLITPHRSYRVNPDKIKSYNAKSQHLEVDVFNSLGETEPKKIPVSENFRKGTLKAIQ